MRSTVVWCSLWEGECNGCIFDLKIFRGDCLIRWKKWKKRNVTFPFHLESQFRSSCLPILEQQFPLKSHWLFSFFFSFFLFPFLFHSFFNFFIPWVVWTTPTPWATRPTHFFPFLVLEKKKGGGGGLGLFLLLLLLFRFPPPPSPPSPPLLVSLLPRPHIPLVLILLVGNGPFSTAFPPLGSRHLLGANFLTVAGIPSPSSCQYGLPLPQKMSPISPHPGSPTSLVLRQVVKPSSWKVRRTIWRFGHWF